METAVTLSLLQLGSMELEGLLPWSSNYSFLVRICPNQAVYEASNQLPEPAVAEIRAVYKPQQGERPLWDFPQGTLFQRERAAYVISQALGWNLVPATVVRKGPHGIGSVQLFIEHDPEIHYFNIEGNADFAEQLQKIALLDIIINNADRKAGHVLIEDSEENEDKTQAPLPERLWVIDHGICFHNEYKLRTVIWEFAGTPIPTHLLQEIAQFQQSLKNSTTALHQELSGLLSTREFNAMQRRTQTLLDQKTFIAPGPGRHYPWPPV
jgi:uncharacterized repeat protein (TIGR03843 family)